MSKAGSFFLLPENEENIALAEILSTPSPKAKDGIILKIQAIDSPTDLVDLIILRIKMTKGPTDPSKKCRKNDDT